MPNSRCSVTMSGFSRQVTVSMPSSACTHERRQQRQRERHAHQALAARADRERHEGEDDGSSSVPTA